MKTRWKILLIVAAFLGLLAGSSLLTLCVQPANKLEAYKKLLRDRGEKLTLSEVLPPPVPDASNCVDAVQAALASLGARTEHVPYAMLGVAPGRAMVGWRQPEARGADFTNSWEDFAAEVAADHPAVELLQQVLERPRLDFHLDYKKGILLLLPHLAPLKRSAQKLTAATVCDLRGGDTGTATTNLCTLLGLVQANQNEATIISQLVRIAMTAIAAAPTWELLQTTNVTEAQLATLQKSWEQMGFLHAAENSFLMERAIMTATLERFRSSHTEFRGTVSGPSGSPSSAASSSWPLDLDELLKSAKLTAGEAMWRASWSYTEEFYMLQSHQIMLETLRTMQTNQFLKPDFDAMMSRLNLLGLTNVAEVFFRALDIPDFSEVVDAQSLRDTVLKTIKIEAARRVVITAIALKRFQLAHEKLPEKLNELVPEFLKSVPIDPNDGKPLRYHPNADGTYLLYSVGEDGVDDGGDATVSVASGTSSLSWQNNRARDWVWPQPATPAEVQYFFEHPPK